MSDIFNYLQCCCFISPSGLCDLYLKYTCFNFFTFFKELTRTQRRYFFFLFFLTLSLMHYHAHAHTILILAMGMLAVLLFTLCTLYQLSQHLLRD